MKDTHNQLQELQMLADWLTHMNKLYNESELNNYDKNQYL